MKFERVLMKIKTFRYYTRGKRFFEDSHYQDIQKKNSLESSKRPDRTEIINYLLSLAAGETCYLEIGVRNPADNFDHIRAERKFGVDPGVEFEANPVQFKMTSDEFFEKLSSREIFPESIQFDVILIDGLHLAEQVDRDIENALKYIKDDGFVVIHDCNPPSEWHARESFDYWFTPAHRSWNGTTWKAFLKWRFDPSVYSCCIDCDWGVGILSKNHKIGNSIQPVNPFFEFYIFDENRKEHLNLVDFEAFKDSVAVPETR